MQLTFQVSRLQDASTRFGLSSIYNLFVVFRFVLKSKNFNTDRKF